MTVKHYTSLIVLLLVTSGCSMLGGGTKEIQIVSKPVTIPIIHPLMPRPVQLTGFTQYVVSDAKIVNRCNQVQRLDAEGNPVVKEDGSPQLTRPRACDKADREDPDMPDGYTKFDQFIDTMKERNDGEVVFYATSIGDYEIQAANMQELKRYINQLGEVIIYYQTINDKPPVEPAAPVATAKPEEKKGFSLRNLLSKDE